MGVAPLAYLLLLVEGCFVSINSQSTEDCKAYYKARPTLFNLARFMLVYYMLSGIAAMVGMVFIFLRYRSGRTLASLVGAEGEEPANTAGGDPAVTAV